MWGGLAKQTNQEPKRRHRAKSSVADSMPGNLKAKKVTTTMTRQEDKENFKTNGAGDAEGKTHSGSMDLAI